MSSITCPSTPGVLAPLFLAMRCLAITRSDSWRKSRYSRLKRRVLSSFASFSRCPSSRITSTIRSITSVRYPSWTAIPVALCPVRGFPTLPGRTSPRRLLRPLCPTCARYCPSQPPLVRKARWFPGSCLVTGMGSGWLPNTFPLTGGLRAGSSAFPGARTYLSSAQGSPSKRSCPATALLAS